MADILIFTKAGCPYCSMAKALLERKGAAYREIDLLKQPQERERMLAMAGGRTTVPQIFIGDRHIGGCDDLHELDAEGGLDPLLT